jgi:hypothetical protein
MGRSVARRGGYTGSKAKKVYPPVSKGTITVAEGTHVNSQRDYNQSRRGPLGTGNSKSGKMSQKNPGPHGYS